MMDVAYLQLRPREVPKPCWEGPFKAVIVQEADTDAAWREAVSVWLVGSGCLFAMTWGPDCEAWHDALDEANIAAFGNGPIPDDHFVMTTWHFNETLIELFRFAGLVATHPSVAVFRTLIIHVADEPRRVEILKLFDQAQDEAT